MSATGAADIPLFDLQLSEEELEAVAATLRTGWLTQGPKVARFEEAFAEQLGARHAIALHSCTAALHLAYLAAGVQPGDEVIVPSITFAATATAATYCGATPVFAECIGQQDPSIDPEHVESLITPRTRAVCAVHFAGYPAAVDTLGELCDRHGIALIEDAAHAPSAPYRGRKLGTHGLAGCFSFFANKVLSCGEGGLVATDDDDVAQSVRLLRSQAMTVGTWQKHAGSRESYDVVGLGYNYRMDEPRAALLLARLAGLEDDIARRRVLTRRYREALAGIEGLVVPYRDEDVDASSCYIMPVFVHDEAHQTPLRRHLRDEHGVQTSLLYPSVHEFTAYRERFGSRSLPRSERHARTELTIPLFPSLTFEMQDRVVDALRTGMEAVAA